MPHDLLADQKQAPRDLLAEEQGKGPRDLLDEEPQKPKQEAQERKPTRPPGILGIHTEERRPDREPPDEEGGLADTLSTATSRVIDRWKRQYGGMLRTLGEYYKEYQEAVPWMEPVPKEEKERVQRELQESDELPQDIPGTIRALQSGNLVERGKKIFSEASKSLAKKPLDAQRGTPKWYLGKAIETGAGTVLPALTVAVVTGRPSLGVAAMGGSVYGESYGESRAEGEGIGQSTQDAAFYAATEAFSEYLPFATALQRGYSALSKTLGTGAAEGITEVLNEAAQIGYEQGVFPGAESPEDVKDMKTKDVFQSLVDAGIIGSLVGTSVGAIGAISDRFRGGQTEEEPLPLDQAAIEEAEQVSPETAPTHKPAEAEVPPEEVTDVAPEEPAEPEAGVREEVAEGGREGEAAEEEPATTEKQLVQTISQFPEGERVYLRDVRQALPDIPRQELDEVLQKIEGEGRVTLFPLQGMTQGAAPEGTEEAGLPTPGGFPPRSILYYNRADLMGERQAPRRQPRSPRRATQALEETQERPRDLLAEEEGVQELPGESYRGMMRGKVPQRRPRIQLSGEREVAVPEEPVRRRDVMRQLEQDFGTRIYSGRVKGKTRLGFFRKKNREIRTKYQDDLEVTAHELGHWIDDRHPEFAETYNKEPYKSELKGVSYDVEKPEEGFAEFLRLYMTKEQDAMEAAPKFFQRFQDMIQEAGIKEEVNRLQESMHSWYYQGAQQRLSSKVGGSPLSIRQRLDLALQNASNRFQSQMFDGLRQIGVAEKELHGAIGDATHSPYKAFRLVAGARGTVKAIYHRGTIGWDAGGDIQFTGKSLEDALAPVSDNLENAKLYFVARRASELKKQGREKLLEDDEIQSGLQLGEEDPRLKTAFNDVRSFLSRMMDFYQQSGIVSKQVRDAMEEANKDYIPFHRIMETVSGQEEQTRISGFRRLKGGTSNLGDPIENIEQSVATLTRMALINRSKQLAYDMVDQSKGGAYYATKIPKESKPVRVTEREMVDRVVQTFGITGSQYRAYLNNGILPEGLTEEQMNAVVMAVDRLQAMEDFTTFFIHGQKPSGDNIDSVMRAGNTEYYEVKDPLWQQAMAHLGPKHINMALRIAGGFGNVLRRGVTSMPDFMVRNMSRDGTNALLFSRGSWKGRIPYAGALRGWSDTIRGDDNFWLYLANGGGFSSTVHGEVEHSIERFYSKEGMNYSTVLDTPRKILSRWDDIVSSFEYGTRIGEFRQVRERGMPLREAAFAGREISTDFSMRGASDFVRSITMMVPFLNARMQGLYKIAREGGLDLETPRSKKRAAAAMAMRGLALFTIPSLALWAWNNWDDDRKRKYQSLPNWVRDMHWVIYVPGQDEPWLIPKPFEVGSLFGSIPERMADTALENSGDLGRSVLWILGDALNLQPIPQFFAPVWEDIANENFMDMPIVPPDLQDVDPIEQYNPWTSEIAKSIGKELGVSPIKVDHYIRGYFGTLGGAVLGMADIALHDEHRYGEKVASDVSDYPIAGIFVGKSPQKRTRQQKEWYEFMQSVREAKRTIDKVVDEGGNPEAYLEERPEAEARYAVSQASGYRELRDQINQIQRAMDRVRQSRDLSAEEKRSQIDQLQRQLNELYRSGAELASQVEAETP